MLARMSVTELYWRGGVFPEAVYYIIEPQPACSTQLAVLAAKVRSAHVHAVALTCPRVKTVCMGGRRQHRLVGC